MLGILPKLQNEKQTRPAVAVAPYAKGQDTKGECVVTEVGAGRGGYDATFSRTTRFTRFSYSTRSFRNRL